MTRTPGRFAAVIVASVAVVGCSSSGSSPSAPTPSSTTSTATVASAQGYLDAVNALCDALLPKVIAVTGGGSIDVPVRKYLASWPAHKRLLVAFDSQVADVPVPAAAQAKAAALAAYLRFADRLDAARLTAAHKGQAAYSKEVQAEAGADYDPAIAALTTAGFNQSCTAR